MSINMNKLYAEFDVTKTINEFKHWQKQIKKLEIRALTNRLTTLSDADAWTFLDEGKNAYNRRQLMSYFGDDKNVILTTKKGKWLKVEEEYDVSYFFYNYKTGMYERHAIFDKLYVQEERTRLLNEIKETEWMLKEEEPILYSGIRYEFFEHMGIEEGTNAHTLFDVCFNAYVKQPIDSYVYG